MSNENIPRTSASRRAVKIAFFTGAAASLAIALVEGIFGCGIARLIVLHAVPFLALWFSVSLVFVLAQRLACIASDVARGRPTRGFGACVFFLVVSTVVAALYIWLVIFPVVMASNVEQTGAGSLWVAASMIVAPIAVSLAAAVPDLL